jgi:hypothetical protein
MWARPSRGWGYVKMTARRQAGTGDMSPPRRAETRTPQRDSEKALVDIGDVRDLDGRD